MNKKRLIKLLVVIICLIFGIRLFIEFLYAIKNSDPMGLNFAIYLLMMPMSIFSIVYSSISMINIFKNNIKITIIDKLVLIIFSIVIISATFTLIHYYFA